MATEVGQLIRNQRTQHSLETLEYDWFSVCVKRSNGGDKVETNVERPDLIGRR